MGQIALAYQKWIHVLGVVLDVEDIPKIIEFVDHIFEREVALYEEYRTQFPNIYKDRCADYFTRPPKKFRSLALKDISHPSAWKLLWQSRISPPLSDHSGLSDPRGRDHQRCCYSTLLARCSHARLASAFVTSSVGFGASFIHYDPPQIHQPKFCSSH